MVKNCTFSLDPDTIALIERLSSMYGSSKSGVVRKAVAAWSDMLTPPVIKAQTIQEVNSATPIVRFSKPVHTGVMEVDDEIA